MPRECAFCPSIATLTGEHVWSDWMNALLPSGGGVTLRRIGPDGKPVGEPWFDTKLDMTTKVVCGTCNSGWMSRLENDLAKPAMADLILGNRVGQLSKKRARGLSVFAFKTAVIANRSLPESEWFFTASERHAFREFLTIPPGTTMFLVGMENFWSGGIGSHSVFFPDRERTDLTLNVCSFWIRHLGFQVISGKPANNRPVESLPTQPGLTVLFHPTIEPQIRWPRKKVLSVEDFHDFDSRWNSIKRW